MKQKKEDFSIYKEFLSSKLYCVILLLAGICTYGFVITHYATSIDDTAIHLYFDEGLAPYMGRWTIYFINKIIPLTQMNPFIVEAISTIIMLLSATVWCVLLKKICTGIVELPTWVYAIFAGLFISCPLISEIYVYYLHNGLCLAYGLTAIALLYYFKALRVGISIKERICAMLLSALFLVVAIGCYETMLFVYVLAAIMTFAFLRIFHSKDTQQAFETNILYWLFTGATIFIISFGARSVIIALLNNINDFETTFASLNNGPRVSLLGNYTRDEIVMNIKWFFIKYVINGICYTPIKLLLISYIALGIITAVYTIIKRDAWIFICAVLVPVIPTVMCFVDDNAIAYRAAQYVPIVIVFVLFMITILLWKICWQARILRTICITLLSALLCLQIVEINQWFMADYARYEYEKDILTQVAQDLQATCDTDKPLIFCGTVETPVEITQTSALSFSDSRFPRLRGMFDTFLPGMTGKNYCPYGCGYHFRETIFFNTIAWGIEAFDGKGTQIIEYLEVLGYSFKGEANLETIQKVRTEVTHSDMPQYPTDGYIEERDDFIIVNF